MSYYGLAKVDGSGKVPIGQLPDAAATDAEVAAAVSSGIVTARTLPVSRTVTGSITLAAADAFDVVRANGSGLLVVTIPTNAADPIPVGTWIDVQNIGTQPVQVLGASGVTFEITPYPNVYLTQRFDRMRLLKVGTDTWTILDGVRDSGNIDAAYATGWSQGLLNNMERAYYRMRNGIVYCNAAGTRDSGTRTGAMFTLPVGFRPEKTNWTLTSNGGAIQGEVRVGTDGIVQLTTSNGSQAIVVATMLPFPAAAV